VAHDLFRKPASIPDQVRDRLFRDHARATRLVLVHRSETFSPIRIGGRPACRRTVIRLPLRSRTSNLVSEPRVDAFLDLARHERFIGGTEGDLLGSDDEDAAVAGLPRAAGGQWQSASLVRMLIPASIRPCIIFEMPMNSATKRCAAARRFLRRAQLLDPPLVYQADPVGSANASS